MSGIHHVTAISGRASRNVDFYTRTLGLRLVKKTVNFDDPGTYHRRSVYFREPGGILFEIATDQPGFAVDESVATLGRDLELPQFLEPRRREIEATLPPIEQTERAA